jgi:hypothetical protein
MSRTGIWQEVYKTETVDNDNNPKWKPFELGIKQLFGKEGKFKVKIIDVDDED